MRVLKARKRMLQAEPTKHANAEASADTHPDTALNYS